MSKPAQWKLELVTDLAKRISDNKLIAVASVKGIRNSQLQQIRKDLRQKARIQVVRVRLLEKALDQAKLANSDGFKESATGQIALITTAESPLRLYEMLNHTKQKAPARGGEIADQDIIIEAKETSFPPGPMVSEFQKAGLSTAIEKGKIVIKKDTVLVKKGEIISSEKAKLMEKLEIFPLTVGLDLLGAYGEGTFYSKESISITINDIMGYVATAYSQAKQTALQSMFLVPEIIPELLIRGRIAAEALSIETGFIDEKNMGIFILKAIREANALLTEVEGGTAEEVKEEKKEINKPEESSKNTEEDVSQGLGALFG
ncbi:MAG: 50S ribosomal protein L10 [Thermoplasmataceae archaeon]